MEVDVSIFRPKFLIVFSEQKKKKKKKKKRKEKETTKQLQLQRKNYNNKNKTKSIITTFIFLFLFQILVNEVSEKKNGHFLVYVQVPNRAIGLMVRMFTNSPGDRGSISRLSHTKDSKKWYLMPLCLTLRIIRFASWVKWSNPRNGVAPSPTPRCCSYWKRSHRVALNYARQLYFFTGSKIKRVSNVHILCAYAYAKRCKLWIHRRTSLMTSSLLLQQFGGALMQLLYIMDAVTWFQNRRRGCLHFT